MAARRCACRIVRTIERAFADPHLASSQAVYASGVAHHSNSLRPQQTVAPLAAKLGLATNTNHPKGDEAALVQAATTIGGTVLIVWEHEAIPGLVPGQSRYPTALAR